MLDNSISENVASAIVPMAALPRRPQRVFVEVGSLLACAARVTLRQVRSDRAKRPRKLICQPTCPMILTQALHIVPTDVEQEKCQAVGCDSPQNVCSDGLRHTLLPLFIVHKPPPIHLLTRYSFLVTHLRHNGIFPCFFAGFVSRLFCSISSALISRGRVSCGSITASM